MLVIAHRGASRDAPENTLASFNMAWVQNAPAIEFDVHLTADGHLVVIHDPDTLRTTGQRLIVRESTLAQLRSLDAGSWKGPQWTGEGIPLLDEVVDTLPPTGHLFIEIKSPAAVAPIADLVTRRGLSPAQASFLGFGDVPMDLVKKALPAYRSFAAFEKVTAPREVVRTARAMGVDGLDIELGPYIDAAFVAGARQRGLAVAVWTVNQEDALEQCLRAGAFGIFTDRPQWALHALAQRALV